MFRRLQDASDSGYLEASLEDRIDRTCPSLVPDASEASEVRGGQNVWTSPFLYLSTHFQLRSSELLMP